MEFTDSEADPPLASPVKTQASDIAEPLDSLFYKRPSALLELPKKP
jgi:hypothetical protein